MQVRLVNTTESTWTHMQLDWTMAHGSELLLMNKKDAIVFVSRSSNTSPATEERK